MTKAAYAAFYAHFGGLLTGQALSDQTAARAVANTPYELRPSARQHCRLVGSTWLDQDTSGTFVGPGEKARSPSPGPSRTPRAPSDPNAPRKPKGLSEQLARQTGKSIFLIFSPFNDNVIQKLAAMGTEADHWPYQGTINKIIEELPQNHDWTDSESKPFGLRKRSSGIDSGDEIARLTMDNNIPDPNVETTRDGRQYPTLGHPAARGCKNCFGLNIDCDLVDRENPHYPCQHCDEEDEACEPCIEPKLKAACYSCKKGRKACSYASTTDEKDYALPCVQCTNDARVCIAGPKGVKKLPSKNGSQTRKTSSAAEDRDPADVAGWDDRKDSSLASKVDDQIDEVDGGKPIERVDKVDKLEGSDELEANQPAESIDKTIIREGLEGNGPNGDVAKMGADEQVKGAIASPVEPANHTDPSLDFSGDNSKEDCKDKPPAEDEDPFADLFEDSTSTLPASGDEHANADVNTKPDEVDQDHIDDKIGGSSELQADNIVDENQRNGEGVEILSDTHSGKFSIPEQHQQKGDEDVKDLETKNGVIAADKLKSDFEEKIDPELQKLLGIPFENGDFTDAVHGFKNEDPGINTNEISLLRDQQEASLFHTSEDAEREKEPPSMPIAPMFPRAQASIFGNGILSPGEDHYAATPTTDFTSRQDHSAFSDESISGLQSLASKAITKVYVGNHKTYIDNQQASHEDKTEPSQQIQKPVKRIPSPRKRKRDGSDEAGPSRPSKVPTRVGKNFIKATGQKNNKHDALALAAEEFIRDVPPPPKKKTFSSKLFYLDDDDEDEDLDGAEDFAFLHRHATESKKKEEEQAKEVMDVGVDTDMGGCDSIWGLASKAAGVSEADASSPTIGGFATNGFKNVGVEESVSSSMNGMVSGPTGVADKARSFGRVTQNKVGTKGVSKEESYKTPSVVDDDDDFEKFTVKESIAPNRVSTSPQQCQPRQRPPKPFTNSNTFSSNRPFKRPTLNHSSSASSSPPPSTQSHHRRPLPQNEEEIIDLTTPSSTAIEDSLTASIAAQDRQLWLARRKVARANKDLQDGMAVLRGARISGGGGGGQAVGNVNGWPRIPYLGGGGGGNGGRMRGGRNGDGNANGGFGSGEMVDLTDDSFPTTAMGVESYVRRGVMRETGGGRGKKKKAYKEFVVLDDSDDDN